MHDISVAHAVTESIIKKLHKNKVKIKKIREIEIGLDLGLLRFHDTEQVRFWINGILKKELGNSVKVKTRFNIIEPVIKCRCGFEGSVNSIKTDEELAHHGIFEIKCPKCKSAEISLEKGNECVISGLRFS